MSILSKLKSFDCESYFKGKLQEPLRYEIRGIFAHLGIDNLFSCDKEMVSMYEKDCIIPQKNSHLQFPPLPFYENKEFDALAKTSNRWQLHQKAITTLIDFIENDRLMQGLCA